MRIPLERRLPGYVVHASGTSRGQRTICLSYKAQGQYTSEGCGDIDGRNGSKVRHDARELFTTLARSRFLAYTSGNPPRFPSLVPFIMSPSHPDTARPSTPQKRHVRNISSIPSTPTTPDTAYVLASEHMDDTPTRRNGPTARTRSAGDIDSTQASRRPSYETRAHGQEDSSDGDDDAVLDLRHTPMNERHSNQAGGSRSGSSAGSGASGSGSGSGDSYNSELLEMLENDEVGDELDMGDSDLEGGVVSDPQEPLTGGRRRRRRRKRFDEEDEPKEKSLFEVGHIGLMYPMADVQLVPPLILAHPLPLLPMLAMLPYNFLPAGVVFFIPILCVLTALSSCAHIVIVYLSWYVDKTCPCLCAHARYLKVPTFEDVFASVTGRYGRYGQWAGRAAVITSTLGLLVGWMESESIVPAQRQTGLIASFQSAAGARGRDLPPAQLVLRVANSMDHRPSLRSAPFPCWSRLRLTAASTILTPVESDQITPPSSHHICLDTADRHIPHHRPHSRDQEGAR
jgi:hypothetical protein